jgi:hypothetical protein
MRKGQSLAVEFILFFLISFSLFSTISFFFYNQNLFFKKRVGDASINLVNDIVSTNLVNILSCKSCKSAIINDDLQSKVGDFYYNITLTKNGLSTSLITEKTYFKNSNIFNINETFDLSGQTISENKKIEINYTSDNIKKIIGIR